MPAVEPLWSRESCPASETTSTTIFPRAVEYRRHVVQSWRAAAASCSPIKASAAHLNKVDFPDPLSPKITFQLLRSPPGVCHFREEIERMLLIKMDRMNIEPLL